MNELDMRQQALEDRENAVEARERSVEGAMKSIESREKLVETTEKALNARENALNARERASPWWNPTIITIFGGLIVAGIGLATNAWVTNSNNKNSQAIEKSQERSNLVLQAIKTNPAGSCKNLLFFVKAGLLSDDNRATQTHPSEERRNLSVARS